MCIFFPVSEGVVPVEVTAPQHVVVLSTPYVICVVAQKAAEDRFCQRVGAGVVDVEYRKLAIGALHLYSGNVVSTRDFNYFPGLSVNFCVDPDSRSDHRAFLPSVGWVDLAEPHWRSNCVEFRDVWLLEEHDVPSCS